MPNKSQTSSGQQNRMPMQSGNNGGGMMIPSGVPGVPEIKMPELPILPDTLSQMTGALQVFTEKMVKDVMEATEGCAMNVNAEWYITVEVEN